MEWIELGELCEIKGGGTPLRSKKEYWTNGNIPWVKISDIQNKYVGKTEEYITEEGFNNSSVKMIAKGSLIYTIFATVGKVGILSMDATTNQAIVGLEIKRNELIIRDYLYYFLKSIEDEVKNQSRGVAQNNINIGIMKKLRIPVPPIEIQKQIVEVLDEAQKLIDNRKKQMELLDELIESIFYDMFGDPVKNDKGWEIKKLDDVMSIDTNMISDFTDYQECPHIGIANIEEDTGKITNYNTVKEDNIKSGKYLFGKNHLIYSKIRPNLNKVAYPRIDGLCSADAYPILAKEEKIDVFYLWYILRTDSFLDKISKSSSRTNIPKVNKKQLLEIEYIIPPLPLQNQFAEKVEQIEQQRTLMEESLKLMEDNYNSLMQRAFKGVLF